MYGFLAEFIVAVHLVYIAFVLVGLLLIVAGTLLRWNWIRNPWFRYIHLTMILIVAVEAAVKFECPLTTWENQLRVAAGEHPDMERSFTSRLMGMVLHPEWASEEKLYIGSMVIAGLVLGSFLFAPPRTRRRVPVVTRDAQIVIGEAPSHASQKACAGDAASH